MTRIVNDQPGSVVLSPSDARIIYDALGIRAARAKYRIGNTAIYRILTDISVAAFTELADPGNLTRQNAAEEDHEIWTANRLANASRLSVRTVRLACQTGSLPAVKQGTTWIITAQDARTFIEARRPN